MTNPQYPGPGDQSGGLPPQPYGGYPQPGSYVPGQQPYPPGPQQYPQPGMHPMYGQPQYPPPAGGLYPPQPRKSRGTAVLVTLVVAVLVIGLGVGGYFLLSGAGGSGDPRSVAQRFVDGDGESEELLCASDLAKIEKAGATAPVPTAPVEMPDDTAAKSELVSVDVPDGSDRGTFTVKTDVTIGTQRQSRTVEYDLVREDGDWKVCGILEASEPGDSAPGAPGSDDPGKPGSTDSEVPGGSAPGRGDSGDARTVAQRFVDSDGTDKALICKADVSTLELAEKSGSGPVALPDSRYSTRTITEVDAPAGRDKGSFTVEISAKGGSSTVIKSLDYDLVQENSAWKVCGVLKAWLG